MSKSTPTIIILLGPPGSGKGTQAKRLAQEFGLPHISTGDLFRENISKRTELGKKAQVFIEAGRLVPDELVLDMLSSRIAQPDCSHGCILDGFPRTIPQAEALQLKLDGDLHLLVFDLEVPDTILINRATSRLLCRQCGSIYSKNGSSSKREGVCDKCGGELYQRKDDNLEVVEERLRVYHRQTAPLIDFYRSKKLLETFNGDQPPDVVFEQLKKATEVASR